MTWYLLLVAVFFQPLVAKADLFDLFFHRSIEAKLLKMPISQVLGSNWREHYHTKVDTLIATILYNEMTVEGKKSVRDEVKKQLRAEFNTKIRSNLQMQILRAFCDNDQGYEKLVKEAVESCMSSSEELINDVEKKVIIQVFFEVEDGQKIKALTDAFFDAIESNVSGYELLAYLNQQTAQQQIDLSQKVKTTASRNRFQKSHSKIIIFH
jgi:hypothetical protein